MTLDRSISKNNNPLGAASWFRGNSMLPNNGDLAQLELTPIPSAEMKARADRIQAARAKLKSATKQEKEAKERETKKKAAGVINTGSTKRKPARKRH